MGKEMPAKLIYPLHDGDVDKPESDLFRGRYYMNIRIKPDAVMVDSAACPLQPRALEKGDIIKITMEAFATQPVCVTEWRSPWRAYSLSAWWSTSPQRGSRAFCSALVR